jgi:23S rRNA pseudouridine955/2504/2580 synthase
VSVVQHLSVVAGESGMRLDRWFRQHFPQVTQGYLQKLLRTGQVRVDGGRAKAADRLEAGQEIRVPPVPAQQERHSGAAPGLSAADRAFLKSITLYEDDDLMVLNKPSGIAVQGGTKTVRHIDGLLAGLGEDADSRPRLVHRLDRDTSGVLVVAKRRSVAAKMGRMFQTRSVRKIYWAVVSGVPKPPQGKVDAALVKAAGPEGDRVRAARPDEHADARSAVTHYAVVDQVGQKFAWMSLKPVTGRQHQLRAHMALLGHPILADSKYAAGSPLPEAVEPRLHLHARRISFSHPATGKPVDVTAPLPKHMEKAFAAFGFEPKDARAGVADAQD